MPNPREIFHFSDRFRIRLNLRHFLCGLVLEEAFMVWVFKTSVLEIVFIELDLFFVLLERVKRVYGFNRLILEKIILFLDELCREAIVFALVEFGSQGFLDCAV